MKKRLFAGLLALCMAVCLLPGTARGAAAPPTSGTLPSGLSWALSSGALTISGTGPIDSAAGADDVPWAESRTQIRSVTIASGVTAVGDYAFFGCTSMTGVSIPATVKTIGTHAFENCSRLSSLTLPQGVTAIGDFAFAGCTGLGSVQFPKDLSVIGSSAFFNCKGLSSAVLRDGLSSIGNSAFSGAGLRTLQIPNSGSITIGDSAFSGTSLGASQNGICLPPSVTSIGDSAFSNCGTSVDIHYFATTQGEITSSDGSNVRVHFLSLLDTEVTPSCTNSTENSQRISRFVCLTPTCGRIFVQTDDMGKPPCNYVRVSVPAACLEDGYEGDQCPICHTFKTKTVLSAWGSHDYGATEATPVLDQNQSYPSTCTRKGQDVYVKICQRADCGYQETVRTDALDLAPHTRPADPKEITVTIVPATCQKDETEVTSYVCTVCHNPVTEEKPTGTPTDLEDRSVHNLGEPVYSDIVEATCEQEGSRTKTETCRDCGKEFVTRNDPVPALGHLRPTDPSLIYGPQVSKEATCEDEGEQYYIYQCQRPDCDSPDPNHRIRETETIPALGHTPAEVEPVPATCSKPGVLGGHKCSVCDEILDGCIETEIDPDAHSYKDVEFSDADHVPTPPTCTEEGVKYVKSQCEWCGTDEPDSEIREVKVPAAGHKDDEAFQEKTNIIPATCGKDGATQTIHFCKICQQEYVFHSEPIPATGEHTFGDWETVTEPTPTTPGERKRTCTVCGFEETEEIPAAYPICTVTLDPNGGRLPDGASSTMKTGTDGKLTAALPEPAMERQVFAGWFTAADGGTEVTGDSTFPADATIYAHWTAEKIYSITLDANGGALPEGVTSPLTTLPTGVLASLPTPTRGGYSFDGWYDAQTGGSRVTASKVYDADATLYAHWTEKTGFTITLDANGGTLADSKNPSVNTGGDGRLTTLPAAPTREAYDFDGWYTAAGEGDPVTTDTVFDRDATIYAHWTAIDTTTAFAIRVDSVGGGVVSANVSTAVWGTKITVLADPDIGCTLSSVTVTAANGRAVEVTRESSAKYTFTMPGSAVDVTASFTRDSGSSGGDSGGGSGSSGSGNNNSSWSGGVTWDPDVLAAETNPEPVPVIQSAPQINAYGQVFQDIPVWHWAAGEIAWASQQGYMNGTGGGSFSPNRAISHQQLWTVLTRLLRYANVSESNLLAVRAGLLDGGNPSVPTTRQELVTALHRCAFLLGGARTPSVSLNAYTDSRQISGYAKDAMAWAVTNGILSGTSDGRLNPNGTVTRAQFAVILFRFSQRM